MKKRAFALFLATVLLAGCQSAAEFPSSVPVLASAPAPAEASSSEVSEVHEVPEIPEVPEITGETFLELGEYTLYDFGAKRSAGRGRRDVPLPTEANYGLTAYTSGRDIYVKAYKNSENAPEITEAVLENTDGVSLPVAITREFTKLSTENMNGLLRVNAVFSNEQTVTLYMYAGESSAWLCRAEKLSPDELRAYRTRREKLARKLKERNVKPKNCVSLDAVTYPCPEFDESYRCDTRLWAELSNELVEPEWSDERKLLAFFDWITENIAYDTYGAEVSPFSRAGAHMDYSGKYSVYELRAGVCMDYAHILLIMCRAHGIPATTIGSKSRNHIWNLVYVNDRWTEIDITCSAEYEVTSEDCSVRTVFGNRQPYDGFGDILLRKNPFCELSDDTFVRFCLQENSENIY